MSTAIVPVDLDAVEERVTPQLSLRGLVAGLVAVIVAIAVLRALVALPIAGRVMIASLGAALSWTLATARVLGATPGQWLVRLATFAATPKYVLPEDRAWREVDA